MEPGFEMVNIYQGDNPEDDNSWVNMNGTMYNGIIPDENGAPVYEDGTSIESYEDGSIIYHYTDSSGNMEYIIQASVVDENDSFLGKTMHVDFKNLGTFSKAEFTSTVEGNWNFKIVLPDVSSSQNIKTRIPYLVDDGSSGYTDNSKYNAYQISGYSQVIDVDEVAALIVLISYENEKVEISISN